MYGGGGGGEGRRRGTGGGRGGNFQSFLVFDPEVQVVESPLHS